MAPINLDHLATTPALPEAVSAMRAVLEEVAGNPHAEHLLGWRAAAVVDRAAEDVATLIGAEPGEIVFTSGATEANNTALKGVMWAEERRGNHLVVSAAEHACVLEAARWLARRDCALTVVPVNGHGRVDPATVAAALRPDTTLVSVQLANNEVGTLQPVAEIAALCRTRGVVMHTDAAQAVGKLPVGVEGLGVDLLSLSGHKMGGPPGVGALWVAADAPVRPEPLLHGGAQQGRRRAGTVPVHLVAGLGAAARVTAEGMTGDAARLRDLRTRMMSALQERLPGLVEHGAEPRLPGCLSVRLPGTEAADLLARLQGGLAASTGSACRAGSTEPSHVLLAMGLTGEEAAQTIRLGIGRGTTEDEIDRAAEMLADAAKASRRLAA